MTDSSAETVPTALAPTVRLALPDPRGLAERASTDGGQPERYRAQGVLGRGGMGEVHLVEDVMIGREIAVKTIAPGVGRSSDSRARFLREVRIQGQLEHPSIVPVYDLGIDSSGAEYFTMKRIAGRTLADVLYAAEETPRSGLLAMFRQVCSRRSSRSSARRCTSGASSPWRPSCVEARS
ncbi:MAG: hypothetical protein HYV09_10910 [Deltaproteobacteria bacterium]|nr:hypothetical protein [Deltaproteobacteria bacterium]